MTDINKVKVAMAAILINNHLSELVLDDPDELDDPVRVVWYDKDNYPYEDYVTKVMWDGKELSLEVEANEFPEHETLYEYDFAFTNVEWLSGIRDNMLETLRNQGLNPCPVCGKPLKGRQRYCSDACRKTAAPPPTVQEVIDTANRRIRTLVNKLIEYEPRIHAGECPEGEYYEEKDCTGKSCALCRKRYYNKLKKKMLEKYSVGL